MQGSRRTLPGLQQEPRSKRGWECGHLAVLAGPACRLGAFAGLCAFHFSGVSAGRSQCWRLLEVWEWRQQEDDGQFHFPRDQFAASLGPWSSGGLSHAFGFGSRFWKMKADCGRVLEPVNGKCPTCSHPRLCMQRVKLSGL